METQRRPETDRDPRALPWTGTYSHGRLEIEGHVYEVRLIHSVWTVWRDGMRFGGEHRARADAERKVRALRTKAKAVGP